MTPSPPTLDRIAAVLEIERDFYAEAEQRLGRRLHPGEMRRDILAIDRTLEMRKAELAAAIEDEKRRVIRQVAAMVPGILRLGITPTMRRIIGNLYDAGQRIARAELLLLGIEATDLTRSFAEIPESLGPRLGQLDSHLGSISLRIQAEAGSVDMAGQSRAAIAREVDRLVPGALDAASRIVSGAFDSGMGDLLRQADESGLMGSWVYSALMDANTCDQCEALDATVYSSWEEISVVLPNGGPNPDCYGDGRCRCMAVPEGVSQQGSVFPGEPLPGPETALDQALGAPTIYPGGQLSTIERHGAYNDAYTRAFGEAVPGQEELWSATYGKLEREIFDLEWKGEDGDAVAIEAALSVGRNEVKVLRDVDGKMQGIVSYDPGYSKFEIRAAQTKVEQEIRVEALSAEEGEQMLDELRLMAAENEAERAAVVGVDEIASTGAVRGVGSRLMQEVAKEAAKRDKGIGLSSLPEAKPFYERLGMHADNVDRPQDFYWTKAEAKRFAETGDAKPPLPPKPVAVKGIERVQFFDDTYVTEAKARLEKQLKARNGITGSRRAHEALEAVSQDGDLTAYVSRDSAGGFQGAAAVRIKEAADGEAFIVNKLGGVKPQVEEALLKRIANDAIDQVEAGKNVEMSVVSTAAKDQEKLLRELGFEKKPSGVWGVDREGLYKLAGREPPAPELRPFGHMKESTLKTQIYRGNKRIKELDHEIAEATRNFDPVTTPPAEAARIQKMLDEHTALHERVGELKLELDRRKAGIPSTVDAPVKPTGGAEVGAELPIPNDPRLAEIQRVYRERRDDPEGWKPQEWRDAGAAGRVWGETQEGDAAMREVIAHGEKIEQVLAERMDQVEETLVEQLWRDFHPGVSMERATDYDLRTIRQSTRFKRELPVLQRKVILDTIREIRPLGGDIEFSGSAELKKLAEQIRDELPAEWVTNTAGLEGLEGAAARQARALQTYTLKKVQRGYFSRWDRTIAVSERYSRIGDDHRSLTVMRHEQGHMAESRVPQLVELERAFYNSRTFGQDPVQLRKLHPGSGYAADELAIPDDFIESYMGKEYGNAFELLSMGLESLLDASHGSIFRSAAVRKAEFDKSLFGRDPEYFRFILGLLSVA